VLADDEPMAATNLPRFDLTGLAVAALSLAIQFAYLAESRNEPTFTVPIIDAATYHDEAVQFARGEPLFKDAFWQPPLFPLLLGCLYYFVGVSVVFARLALAGLGTASCVLIWWIGRRVFSRRVGVVAGAMAAAYGPFLFFSTQLLPTGLAIFLDLVALALWLRCLSGCAPSRNEVPIAAPRGLKPTAQMECKVPLGHSERSVWYLWLLFGLSIGAATITIPNAAIILVIALPGILVSGLRRCRRVPMLVACAMTLLGTAIPIGSVTLRNYLVFGKIVLISTNGGINFYIGNNANSDETVAIRPGERWKRLARESYLHGARTRVEQDAYFLRQGLTYAVEQPVGFLLGLGRKAIQLINAREIPRNVDPYVYRDYSRLLSTLLWRADPFAFPFGLLAPLTAVGIVISLSSSAGDGVQRAGRYALLTFILAYGASVVLFFVSARYRLPMVVVMTVFAAAGACWVWDRIRARLQRENGRRAQYAAATAFAATAIVVNLPVAFPTDGVNFRAELAMCVGHAHATAGRYEEAESYLREALRMDPHYADAAGKLASVVLQRGESEEAEALLRQALNWDEQSIQTRRLLAELLHRKGQTGEAIALLEQAITVDPTSPEAHSTLADVFADSGRPDDAIKHYRQAADLTDESGPILIRLADLLVQTGAYEEAIERYRQGLWRVDADPETLNRIAWLLATCPVVELRDCGKAIEIAEHLCQITEYAYPVAMDTLAAAYAECGRLEDAVKWVRRAIDTALASNDPEAAASFHSRLQIYQARLSASGGRVATDGNDAPDGE
jgi:tetratricopeptide (TPR) repeat protein